MMIAQVLLALLVSSSLLELACGNKSAERFPTHVSPSDNNNGRDSGTLAAVVLNTAPVEEGENTALGSTSDTASPVKGIIEAPWIRSMQDDTSGPYPADGAFQVDTFNSAGQWLRSMVEDAPWLKDTLTHSGHSPEGMHSSAPWTPSSEGGMLSSAPWNRNDKSGVRRESEAAVSEMMLTRAPWTRSADETSSPAVMGMLSGSPWTRSVDDGMLTGAPWIRSANIALHPAAAGTLEKITEAGMLSTAPWVRSREDRMLMNAPWARTTIEGGMLLTAPWNGDYGPNVEPGSRVAVPATGTLFGAPWTRSDDAVPPNPVEGMLYSAPWVREAAAHVTDSNLYNTVTAAATRLFVTAQATFVAAFVS